MNIRRIPFLDVLADESGGNIKTPQGEYKKIGKFPVVDQGKSLVAGYVDDESRLCGDGQPAIVFGDHTRCVKYIDFPFCMGADGVKVLRPKIEADLKYLYYYLRKLNLPDAGYSRHFKYLKRADIALPPLPEQRRIAAILDQADALSTKRREALAQLDSLTQSIFIEMFGDLTNNHCRVKYVQLSEVTSRITDGTHLTPKFISAGVPFIFVKNFNNGQIDFQTDKFISEEEHAALYKRYPVERGDVLYTTVGATYGQAVAIGTFTKFAFQRHVAHLKPDAEKILPKFLGIVMQLPFVKRQADRWARGAAQPTINLTELRQFEIPLPTLIMQREFAKRVSVVDKLKATHRAALAELDALFASLQHRAFRGEL